MKAASVGVAGMASTTRTYERPRGVSPLVSETRGAAGEQHGVGPSVFIYTNEHRPRPR